MMVQAFSTNITVEEYISKFRNEKKFLDLCKMCPNYGKSWGCPPFEFDAVALLSRYKYARLYATKIVFTSNNIPLDMAQEILRPERIRIEKELLDLEKELDGHAFLHIGECLYCSGMECKRKRNLPCSHPDKVRPSLEAFGFDIERTLSELFGIKLLWSTNGVLPEYLVLVSGLFHNKEEY